MTADRLAIRDLDQTALPQAAALLAAAFPHWLPTLAAAEAEVREALLPERVAVGAWRGGDLLGFTAAIPDYPTAWELHPLVVRADARGTGVGRVLVAALEERVRAKGALTLWLGTDDDGPATRTSAGGVDLWPDPLPHAAALVSHGHPVGFYRKVGFVVVGLLPDANGPGRPDILMAKRIGPAAP